MRFYLHTCAYCYIYIFMYVTIIVYMYMIYIDSIHLNVVSHHSVLASSQLIGFRFFVVNVVKVSTHNWHGTYIIVVSKALFQSVLQFANSDLTSFQVLSSLSVTTNILRSSTSGYQANSRLSSKRITFQRICLARMQIFFTLLNPSVRFMIAFITWNSNLVPLLEGLCSSNPCKFELSEFLEFCRNRTDDLRIDSPALWPAELV